MALSFKIEAIIRDEMDGIGAQEILVPIMTLLGSGKSLWSLRMSMVMTHAYAATVMIVSLLLLLTRNLTDLINELQEL